MPRREAFDNVDRRCLYTATVPLNLPSESTSHLIKNPPTKLVTGLVSLLTFVCSNGWPGMLGQTHAQRLRLEAKSVFSRQAATVLVKAREAGVAPIPVHQDSYYWLMTA